MVVLKKSSCWVITLLAIIPFIQCQTNSHIKETNIVDAILNEKESFFYLDTENYPELNERLPIGVFDSGTGGLTVLDAIINLDQYDNKSHSFKKGGDGLRDFQEEYFIYLGDQANMPYGNYPRENKTNLLKEHVIKDIQFLLGNKYYPSGDARVYKTYKVPVKAIVIACNTATAYGKADIEKFMDKAGIEIKVIGVIGAGVRAALSLFQKDEDGSIGIMATAGTVASLGYVKSLNAQRVTMNYTGDIAVFQQAGVGLAGAIDGSHEYIAPDATLPRREYRGPLEKNPDARIDQSILQRYGFEWKKNKMLFKGDVGNPEDLQINSVKNYISYHLVSLLEEIRKTHRAKPLKVIILGCTHYPFYRETFQKKLEELYNYRENGEYLYRPFMARHIELVDPAVNTTKELYEYLVEIDLFNDENFYKSEFYVSVPNKLNSHIQVDSSGDFTYEYKYGRNEGFMQEYVKRVPFSKKSISIEVIQRLSEKVPSVFELIRNFNYNNSKTVFLQENERI